ncbi:MAG: lamin tail domain-containing protein, partial [Lapillicoccus sp.]
MPVPSPSLLLRRAAAATLVPVLGALGLAATAAPAHAVDTTSPVVLSEVYGGGGNTGAPYRNDFIELYNHGTASVDLSTWSVQYASSTGTSWQVTNLVGSIAPGQFYLVQEGAGAGTSLPALPTPDATGTVNMSGTAGKVALVNTRTALAGCTAFTDATPCSTASGVVDFVGFGTANDAAGGTPTAAPSNSTSAQRTITPYAISGVNGADFTVAAPTPKAAPATVTPPPNPCAVTPLPPECVAGTTTIQDIQGSGFLSPLKGQVVAKVEGVVTAVRSSGSRGFWMQQANPDATRTASSSGIFVFTSSAPTVKVGDAVLVSGTATDYYPLSSGETITTTANLSTTEITTVTTVTVVSSDNPLPAPLVIAATTVPARYAPTLPPGTLNIETISPVDPINSVLEFWEAHEGMLVSVNDVRVVGPGQPQYGEIYVTTKPAELATSRGGTYL